MTIKILLIIDIKEYQSKLLRNYGTYQMTEGSFRETLKFPCVTYIQLSYYIFHLLYCKDKKSIQLEMYICFIV